MSSADIIVAGAGIIGLSTALELAGTGLRVLVIERGQAMREASWAAAGMLAAHDPENLPALRELSELSLRLYPDYLERVERLSGQRVPLRTALTLQGSRLGRRFHESELLHGRRLSAAETGLHVAGLAPADREYILLEEHSLDPRDLCAALPIAAIAGGVELRQQTDVLSVTPSANGVEVHTSRGTLSAGAFVSCCGAWAGESGGGRQPVSPGIEPCKGQILTVRLPDWRLLECVVRTPETYLVPRGDGRVVIGATLESAGFDKAVHDEAMQSLLAEAAAVWPPVDGAAVVETWAGLRPGTADGIPLMGRFPLRGADAPCWLATGHFRNGILLAPATARVMAQAVIGSQPDADLAAFACDRFAPAGGTAAP